ncbi:hypothetical protein LTR36_006475 [Oleoguttula mirabilis]|uniref:BTB domain-containing protein n=1 Tax=Oleoguttula mirabilis TaxID=1507867 RepID=A0AAV9JXV7_9PEZI|nr:hypothetical protein LTR36_006475 [Oleoguttula mirabilis]
MDDGYDHYDDDEQHTPYHDPMTPSDSSPWSFHGAVPSVTPERQQAERPERAARPRVSRHSSLPRSLFGAGSSLFGSASGHTPAASTKPERKAERDSMAEAGRPLMTVTQPSQEHIPTSQPPLSTLSGPSVRERRLEDEVRSTAERRILPRVEKDADDPTTPPVSTRDSLDRQQSTTLTTLSRLFAVQSPSSPDVSRHSSYLQAHRQPSTYTRNLVTTDVADLPNHLYSRGLLQGRHSDITVNAFGHQYKLHRLILDRAPFFTSALSAPWLEANAKEVTVHPEDLDDSITQSSFELALKRLYGCGSLYEEDHNAIGLFTTGCWLEMQDLIDSSIESMLRQMTPETLSPLVRLVTGNYYGRAGDKILASAKAMLCRDGWKMPIQNWDGIPGDIIREIVGGDGFFIDGEFDRWVLAKRILDRRLKARAIEAGLLQHGSRRKVRKAPDSVNLMAVRFDGVYRKSNVGRGVPDALQQWIVLYTHPDVEPILVLLDEGIHYIHLDFEQLQFIRRARDCLGLPVMPEKVISSALWQQMELRQKVMNARETDMELDLSVKCTDDSIANGAGRDTTMSITTPSEPPSTKGKHRATDVPEEADEEIDSGSWDGNGKPRKFWIPSSDCNIVMGGNADPVIATSTTTTLQRHAQSRLSATIQPEDIQWASDFAAITSQPRPPSRDGGAAGGGMEAPPDYRYTHFPPFRFAAEFPNPRLLKEKKRVYSRTVFYAGSLWNIYIQKVATTRNKQLGVYLHRAKERETEEVLAGTAGLAQGGVDERIGQLEREMILRSERRERRQRRRTTLGSDGTEVDGGESSGSAGDGQAVGHSSTIVSPDGEGPPHVRASTMRNLLSRGRNSKAAGQPPPADVAGSAPSQSAGVLGSTAFSSEPNSLLTPDSENDDAESYSSSSDDDDDDDEIDAETARLVSASQRKYHVPTLPPYVDARPTIRTYFKIYSPSRGGRMLSVYESAPDRFNFSQSWGWKSSTLMLDEGLLGEDEEGGAASPANLGQMPSSQQDDGGSAGEGAKVGGTGGGGGRAMKGRGDGKLRFMVVIGNT